MRIAALILVIVSVTVVGYFSIQPVQRAPTGTSVNPTRDDLTLRNTTAGAVVGFVGKHGARTWLGIPFAQPPIKALRWRPPQPPTPWADTRETLAAELRCPQLVPNSGIGGSTDPATVQGNEDCLYLNVYSPVNAGRLPVMLWIHGGGNSVGTGSTYNGSMLATRENVVVITINYRLGPLGWFSHPALATGDAVADSGNYATLDIIRALEWTRDNIADFGGDPNRVSVFGESAGATNVLSLVASPLAANLFHRGIVQSGGFTAIPLSQAQRYANDGGHSNSAREIVNQLLVADGSATSLAAARAQQDAMAPDEIRNYLSNKTLNELFASFDSSNFGMLPTPKVLADGHVLPTLSADEIFSNPANHNSVPMILGTNRDEPSLFMFAQPRHVDRDSGVPRLRDPAGYLREVKYGALAWKERGVDSIAANLTKAGNTQVFAYRFDWDEEGTVNGIDLATAFGAAHGVELPFVFGDFDSGYQPPEFYGFSEQKQSLANSITAYWSEFAATGNPGTGRDGKQPPWLAWGSAEATMLILDTPSDQGIFMAGEPVTVANIKAELAVDPAVANNEERCRLYAVTFPNPAHFDPDEFATFGPEGCANFDPGALRQF